MARKIETRKRSKALDKYKVVELYLTGKTEGEIATLMNSNKAVVSKVIVRHIKELTNTKETRLLTAPQTRGIKAGLKTLLNTKSINSDFTALLSPPGDQVLTIAESVFCEMLIATGDAVTALVEAGLDAGLQQPNSGGRNNYDKCLELRAKFLLIKPNVRSTIDEMRKQQWTPYAEQVNKEFVQVELLQQLSEMKFKPSVNRKEILSCLKMVGETVAAYSTSIAVTNIDPAQALDDLIELAGDKSEIKTLTHADVQVGDK